MILNRAYYLLTVPFFPPLFSFPKVSLTDSKLWCSCVKIKRRFSTASSNLFSQSTYYDI